jgi:hypothetical protein
MDYEKHIHSLDQMLADLTIENKRLKSELLDRDINLLPIKDAEIGRLQILLSKVKNEFDNGGVTWETRDEIENIFR